jgi:hypothetical protein
VKILIDIDKVLNAENTMILKIPCESGINQQIDRRD